MPEPIYLDPELAARADALFRELGLDLSTAVQLFLRQALREHGLPFTPRLTPPPAVRADQPSGEAAASGTHVPAFDEKRDTDAPSRSESETNAQPLSCQENSCSEDDRNISEPEEAEAEPAPGSEAAAEESAPEIAAEDEERETIMPRTGERDRQEPAEETADGAGGELRQAFLNARLIGAPLRRVRSLNRLYSIGEPNDHVQGWREVYVSGDEPFALDFGMVRVELGFHGGGSLRMMDGRLPDKVLEADAVYPRDLSAVFSSIIGQRLVDVSSSRIWNEGHEREQLCLRFANGCTLNFAPGGDWGALWLTDAHGSVMFAPEAVWLRVLDDRVRNGLR